MDAQTIVGYVLVSINAFVGIIIILVVLLQGGKIRGIGSAITGASDSTLFDKVKKSVSERFSTKLTWFLASVFIIMAFVIIILIKQNIISL